MGRRTKKSGTGVTTTYFLSDGTDEIAEYDSTGAVTTRYVPGPAIDEPIAVVTGSGPYAHEYFHTNRQGSVVAMSDDTGAKVEGPYTYDPYGNCFAGGSPCSATGVPYRFTGRRFDAETGLYYYRARCYIPTLGRFCQTDPVGYDAGMNLYTYVGNDPTDKTDPTGEFSCVDNGNGTQTCTSNGSILDNMAVSAYSAYMHLTAAINSSSNSNQSKGNDAKAANDGSKNDKKNNNNGNGNEPPPGKNNETGHYTNTHESGKQYSGKGSRERSQVSGRRIEKETGDKHTATDWKPSSSQRGAYEGEAGRIKDSGGVKSPNNYNKINSPGEKYLNEGSPDDPNE